MWNVKNKKDEVLKVEHERENTVWKKVQKMENIYVKNEIIEMKGKFCLKYHRNVIQVHVYNKKIGFNVFILRDLKCPRSWFVSHIHPNLWYLK